MDISSATDRVVQELRWTATETSATFEEIEHGFVARTPELPLVRAVNHVRISDQSSFEVCKTIADRYMGDLPYRHVVIEDQSAAQLVEGAFRDSGWNVARELVMSLEGPPDRETETAGVVVLSQGQMLDLMAQWAREEHVGITEERVDQLSDLNRRAATLWNERCFGTLDGSLPVSICKLRVHDSVAWIEDVYTLPAYRGNGLSRAAVTCATNEVRPGEFELVFLQADDEDWPKNLYHQIGSRPLFRHLVCSLNVT